MLQKSDYNETFYNNGGDIGGYDNYSENSYLNEPPSLIAQRFKEKLDALGVSIVGKKILVSGCAYGFLVKYLVQLGADAYGFDISTYAISQAPSEISSRVFVGDASEAHTYDLAKNLASLSSEEVFDYVVDEDMLACLTDSEALSFKDYALANSRLLLHLIDPDPGISQWYNYKPIQGWKDHFQNDPTRQRFFTRFGINEA